MATSRILKHGFKAKAERLAVEYRAKLSLQPFSPLCAFKLAEHLNIPIYNATEFITSPEEIESLSGTNGKDCGWSALTMTTQKGNKIIIHNPYHHPRRQQSNVMHEIAHIICKHGRKELTEDIAIPLGMRDFNEEQEEEAKCLGATFQITRPGLMWAVNQNMSNEEMASYFNASTEMVTYRLNTSGVLKQNYYSKKKR